MIDTNQELVKVSAVSYFNTKPFIDGINSTGMLANMDLDLAIPAITALKFINDEVAVALLPIAVLPQLTNYTIITDYCIGAIDKVKTVSIFAQQPLNTIKRIYLDYQSRTSVALVKVLLKEYWQLNDIELMDAKEGVEQLIKGTYAALLIGDKTFPLLKSIPYQYDLATAWNDLTKMPFAFAVWVAKPNVSAHWIAELNKALEVGVKNRMNLANEMQLSDPNVDWMDYFCNCISYELDDAKRQAIQLFLQKIN